MRVSSRHRESTHGEAQADTRLDRQCGEWCLRSELVMGHPWLIASSVTRDDDLGRYYYDCTLQRGAVLTTLIYTDCYYRY